MPNLNTDFKDDILDISNPERKYQLIYNPDGTVSLRDVTVYQQTGSLYGAKEVNEERAAINKINNDRIVTLDEIDLVNQAGFFVDALAVKEINSALSKKSNTDHLHDGRYYTESEIDEKINSINSKFSSELTQGTSGSPGNQGVFKGQSGIMIIWGAHPTTAFAHNSGANYYYADISFRTAFKENPIVMATPRFSGGIPENVGTLSVTSSKLRLGCNVQASGLYIEWIAVGKWK